MLLNTFDISSFFVFFSLFINLVNKGCSITEGLISLVI
uniref:Uncharacterized protein n=1 Tax=Lepeophtheirus salmonis TaxID=72036 RepID=A0A0K2UUJ0_LEPSM